MISLNGQWTLFYRLENGDVPWPQIPSQVPGNVELDLANAGVEPDPFFGENIYLFRKYEFYEWRMERVFRLQKDWEGQSVRLTLEGVNTYADIIVNGEHVGICDNMFIAHSFDVSDVLAYGQENRIVVHIHSAVNKARQRPFPVALTGGEHTDEFVWQRKPPHSFGWDIMPRLPSAGLWRGVHLDTVADTRITQAYYATLSATQAHAKLVFKYRFTTGTPVLEGFSVRVTGDGFRVEQPALFVSGEGYIEIDNPRLWWPSGYGDANLYQAKMELLRRGEVVDTRTDTIGIRRIKIEHVMKSGDEGQFLIRVNDTPILAKGSNWVPLDAMHSRDASKYERALSLFREMGCNIVRCWGGNVYEDHRFFDLCDRYGLLVWQDFAMACAIYPQNADFYRMIEKEAESIIIKVRNHPSIMLWAGDNEVDEVYIGKRFATDENRYNAITRKILPRCVRMHDPYRMFLPSSPYIPGGIQRYDVPEQHNWGARAYFKDDFYKHTKAHFVSECGYHGCPSPKSIVKFIPGNQLWPYTNSAWDTHNTDYRMNVPRRYNRNQLMADQVAILLGHVPQDLETFSLISQFSQAEAMKFFVERTRIQKWRRTGIIWWNMLDGWPQISDAVVDYYFDKKLAFTWLRRVHTPICLMMDELRDWGHDIVLSNDSRRDALVAWRVEDGETGKQLLSGETMSKANENAVLGSVRELAGTQRLYLLRWSVDEVCYGNHYVSGFPPYPLENVLQWIQRMNTL